ncbi:kinase-like domain-containing protein [Gymnopilus junonius]|uniref:Kinase-like domain-containing protein n=1 Tax=Gymnopilus junonius TaxID=109634 RepID=A0A9P5NAB6_GYMJU|nr:kinase-like domain-containing protein [Gymnopilus junonius]
MERKVFIKVKDKVINHIQIEIVLRNHGVKLSKLVTKGIDVGTDELKMLKIICRSKVPESKIISNITWLRRRKRNNGRHSEFIEDFKTKTHWFIVFEFPRTTLQDILSSAEMVPLPDRHVREMISQITSAVLSLHKESIMHLDIQPQSIEIVNAATGKEFVYQRNSKFIEKGMQVKNTNAAAAMIDIEHRKWYLVNFWRFARWASRFRSDNFSIGCLFWEMIKGQSMFLACDVDDRMYRKAKAHMFTAILGYFPDDMRIRISMSCQGIFKRGTDELEDLSDLPTAIQEYLRNCSELEASFDDEDILDVTRALTHLSPKQRPPLENVLCFRSFQFEEGVVE